MLARGLSLPKHKVTMDGNFTFEFGNFTSPITSVDICLQHQSHLEQNKNHAIAVVVLNLPLCVTAMVANSAILIALWKTPSLHSPSNILLANLALSDFGVGFIVQPWAISLLLEGMHGFSSTYRFLCRSFPGVSYLFGGVSFIMISAIGLDRLLALQLHLRYNSIITHFRAILAAIGIWFFVALSMIFWLWKSPVHTGIGIGMSIILGTNFIVYLKIHLIVRRHQAQVGNQQPQANNGKILRLLRLKTSIVNTFLVFILMVCCYTPQILVLISKWPSFVAFYITSTIAYLNSSLNPFLYFWRFRELRSAVKQQFCRWELWKQLAITTLWIRPVYLRIFLVICCERLAASKRGCPSQMKNKRINSAVKVKVVRWAMNFSAER